MDRILCANSTVVRLVWEDGRVEHPLPVLGGQGWATRRPESPSWEDSGNELN